MAYVWCWHMCGAGMCVVLAYVWCWHVRGASMYVVLAHVVLVRMLAVLEYMTTKAIIIFYMIMLNIKMMSICIDVFVYKYEVNKFIGKSIVYWKYVLGLLSWFYK